MPGVYVAAVTPASIPSSLRKGKSSYLCAFLTVSLLPREIEAISISLCFFTYKVKANVT